VDLWCGFGIVLWWTIVFFWKHQNFIEASWYKAYQGAKLQITKETAEGELPTEHAPTPNN
jgi:hypothetical protein